jgi:hypothetical protein
MRSTQELRIYHKLISRVIEENHDDPRIETPKRSLEIIEAELKRREEMAKNFNKMSIEELEAFRDEIARERDKLKDDFTSAGKVLNVKLQEEELAKKQAELDGKKEELEEKMPKPQTVNLKTLVLKGKALLGKE